MADKYWVYRPLLDLIGFTEGTDKGDGYDETLNYGKYTGGDVDLVHMTLDEVDRLQTGMLRHPKNYLNSSAVGRYQIVRTTLRDIKQKLKLTGDEHFDAEMQDRMGCFLLGKRGIDDWLAGRKTDDAMLTSLAQEWASLPKPDGFGYYGGQHAAVTPGRVLEALRTVKLRASATSEPAPPPAPKVGWFRRLWIAFLNLWRTS